MANTKRGEVSAVLEDREWTLCLTLEGLAKLEQAFGCDHLMALAERFSTGRFSATELTTIVVTGLRGGGHEVTREQVASMRIEGGASAYVTVVTDLLRATFTGSDPQASAPGKTTGEAPANPSVPQTPTDCHGTV